MELFFLKLLDGALGTAKSLFLVKNREFLASLAGALGTYFYLTMMVKLVKVNSSSGVLLICFATFLGTFIPMLVSKKLEKNKVFVFNITPDTNDNGKAFADEIRKNNIPILTYKGYNMSMELVVCCKIFTETKKESKLIEEMIPNNFKYHVIETKTSIAA